MRRTAFVACLVALVGCGGGRGVQPAPVPPTAVRTAQHPGKTSHVFVIVMENKEYGEVIGSTSAPYLNALARRYASATGFYGVRHPSLPNYLALTGGSTFGVTSDCSDCQQSAKSVVDQLEAARVSWKAYMGGMPKACFGAPFAGEYAKKHDPFMYYTRVAGRRRRCAKVVPERVLVADLKKRRLPTFGWLSPGLCDDTHDCSVGHGDAYLRRIVPPILKALGPRGFLVVTYDEGASNSGCCGGANGGRIATVIAGPKVRRGARLAGPFTHYSTLRLVEDALRLPRLRRARSASSLRGAFRAGVPHLR